MLTASTWLPSAHPQSGNGWGSSLLLILSPSIIPICSIQPQFTSVPAPHGFI